MERKEGKEHKKRKVVEVRKGLMERLRWNLGEHMQQMRGEHKKTKEEVRKTPKVSRTIQFQRKGRKELVGKMKLDSLEVKFPLEDAKVVQPVVGRRLREMRVTLLGGERKS